MQKAALILIQLWLVLALGLAGPSRLSHASLCQDSDARDRGVTETPVGDEIEQLLSRLNGPSFRERERATRAIINLGPAAVPTLAKFALEASPEMSRRIKMCLEEIGVQGSEENLFQTMALLMLLFDRNSEKMEAKVSKLRAEWVTKRSEMAIQKLASLGARVERAPAGQEQMFNGLILPSRNPLREQSEIVESKPQAERLPVEKMREQVTEILAASLSENQKRVFGDVKAKPKTRPAFNSTILGGQQAIVMEGRLVMIDAGMASVGTTIAIGDRWSGDVSDLKVLQEVENLMELRLQDAVIDQELVRLLGSLQDLTRLAFNRCTVEAKDMSDGSFPELLTTLEFVNTEIDRALIDQLGKLTVVRNLQFEDCSFASDALEYFAQQDPVAVVALRKMRLGSNFFKSLAKTDKLNYLVLSGCKFEISEFDALTRARRDLRVELVPMAFLGVQSDIVGYNEELGCVISSVVAGSAAAEAGVKVNDRIASLDGHEIARFEDLKTRISQYVPGEEIELAIERNGKRSILKAKLRGVDERPRF